MMSDLILAAGSSFAVSTAVKSGILAAAGLIVLAVIGRRWPASVRHLALGATFAALLMLPVAASVAPSIEVPVMSETTARPMVTGRSSPPRVGPTGRRVRIDEVFARGFTVPRLVHAVQNWSKIDWSPTAAGAVWLAYSLGALAVLASLGSGLLRIRRLRKKALPCLALQDVVAGLASGAGVTRRVDIFMHESVRSPLTFGLLRPAIVVPADADTWAGADLQRALVHELEHIRRYDWILQIAARAVCAIYWFNPLVWMAWRKLCLEAERSCDDAVVRMHESAEYAEQLVLLARRCSTAAPVTLAMARRSDLSARVSAVLDSRRGRGRVGRAAATAVLGTAALLLATIAPLHAVAMGSSDGDDVSAEQPEMRASSRDRALYRAAERGDLQRMAELVQAGARVDAAIEGDGTPLIGAAREGRLAAVAWLLDKGADPNLAVGGDGNPLIMAARQGHVDVAGLLLDRGASIDQVVDGDENALIQASAEGRLPVVKLLVARGANVNARVWVNQAMERPNGEWRTPLSMARKGGHTAVVTVLIAAGAQ